MSELTFSIIVPTHFRSASVKRLLESLKKLTLDPTQWDVWVVSNLPDPALESVINNISGLNLKLGVVGKVGVNRARNWGLLRAKGRFVFFLDDDCEIIDPDHLQKFEQVHRLRHDCVAIGGGYEAPKDSSRCELAYQDIASQWFEKQKTDPSGFVTNLLGGNVCYKREVLVIDNILFDEAIIFGAAESEFHDRLLQKGLKICADGPSVLHHVEMNWLQYTQKAFLQGCGSIKRMATPENRMDWSWLFIFWKFHYQRFFNKGRAKAFEVGYSESVQSFPTNGWWAVLETSFLYISLVPMIFRLLTHVYWALYRACGQSWVLVKVAIIELFWFLYSIGSELFWFLYTIGSELFWFLYSIGSELNGLAWRLMGLANRIRVFFYWKIVALKGWVRNGLIRTYWFLHYLRFQFHKDVTKKLELMYLGIDPTILPPFLPLASGPSYFFSAAVDCEAQCKYCPQLKARQPKGALRPQSEELKRLGFSKITYSCSYPSLKESEKLKLKSSFSELDQEVLVNPDFFKNWDASLFRDVQILLLFRPTEMFETIYRDLKTRPTVEYRILFVFDISGDAIKWQNWIEQEDWSKIQLLNISDVAPEVTDDRNRKLLPKLGHLLGRFTTLQTHVWPAVSHLHAPFLVGDSALAHYWIEGKLRWQSPLAEKAKEKLLRFSVIVPVRYQLDYAQVVLANLSRQKFDLNQFEIIFVDDGNSEDLSDSIQKAFVQSGEPPLQVKVVHFPRETPGGYDHHYRAGQARNMGLRFSRGQKILFVDSDILISPDLFSELENILVDNMIVQFPRHMLTQEATQNFSRYENINLQQDTYSQNSYWEEFKKAENWEGLKNYWKYTCTYGLAITRKTLEMTGPFRADYIFYGFEDVDLGYRVFQNKGRFLLHKTPVYHMYPDEKNSFHFDAEKRYQALSKSASVFFRRNMDLNFYFDLKGFLNRPWYIRARKPYYFLKYQWDKITSLFQKRDPTQAVSGS